MIFFLVLPLAALFCFVFHTEVETYLCSVLFLNALPVPLLRQVFVLCLFGVVFRVCFLLGLPRVPRGSLGALGTIFDSFGSVFSAILVTFRVSMGFVKMSVLL